MATSTIVVPSVASLKNHSPAGTAIRSLATQAKADIEAITGASLGSGTPAAVGAAGAAGSATTASKSDHVHADPQRGAAGTNLTDADATVAVGGGLWRKLVAGTLTDNRTATLGTSGAAAGDQITITRTDVEAFTYAIVNGGGGGGTLLTLPASKLGWVKCQYDGTNWALREFGMQP